MIATQSPAIGATVICAETGKSFTVARDGCSVNYATDTQGRIYSDEGVDIRERRQLLDRSRPFGCYISCDGRHVTGWKGNRLGDVVRLSRIRNPFGGYLTAVTVRDVHGGMCITLRPSRAAR